MADSRVIDLMRKHPPWFIFDFHPIRFSIGLSEEEQKNERDVEIDGGGE